MFFGYKLFENQEPALKLLESLPNVNLKGIYGSFEELPTDEYMVFLFTSTNEGMPNVLLEAGLAGLPVVATAVGGVPELIDSPTGYSINPNASESDYIEAIRNIHANPLAARKKAQNLQELVLERHSWENFKKTLSTIPDYLT